MKKIVTLILIAVFVSAAYASEPENENKSTESMTNSITGKIIDGITGEALAGVYLKLDDLDLVTYSDLKGNFTFSGLSKGQYDINVNYVSYKDVKLQSISTTSEETFLKVELESVSSRLSR